MNQSIVGPGRFLGLVAVITGVLMFSACTDSSTAADNWAAPATVSIVETA